MGGRKRFGERKKIKYLVECHSEERSDEESHFEKQFGEANQDSPRHRTTGAVSLLPVAQNDMAFSTKN
jgi:hypothetical protein